MTRPHTAAGPALITSTGVRGRELTDVLLADRAPALAPGDVAGWCERLSADLARVTAATVGAPFVRVDAHHLTRTLSPTPHDVAPTPFRWSPRAARRTIGLAAVRAHVEQVEPGCQTPVGAVEAVMADPRRHLNGGGGGSGSCADWVLSLSRPARSLVAAEAVTWATRLATALEWRRIGPLGAIGTPDQWWEPAGTHRRLALRGRSDVRVGAPEGPSAFFTVLGGVPRPSSRVELTLAGLVAMLARPGEPAPSKVVGWWPDCGRAAVVTVDGAAVAAVVDAVVGTVRSLLRASLSVAPSDR